MSLDLTMKPFSGVGIVSIYPLTAGVPGVGTDLGEVPKFDVGQDAPVSEMKTSRDQSRGVAFRMAQSKAASLQLELNTLNDATQALLTSGVWTDVVAGSAVTNWPSPSGLVVGNLIRLPHRNVSAVTVTDRTGSPKTLVAGTNYELDPVAGTLRLLDLTTGGAFVQPFDIDYTPGAVSVLGAFKAPDTDFLIQLNGTNAYNGDRVVLEGFKFRFAAQGTSSWISNDYGKWQFNGSLLLDTSRAANSVGGQFYSITKPSA